MQFLSTSLVLLHLVPQWEPPISALPLETPAEVRFVDQEAAAFLFGGTALADPVASHCPAHCLL